MKTKIVFVLLIMLIALPSISQEDTIKLPFSIAQKVALDLEELDRLKAHERVSIIELGKYKQAVEALQKVSSQKDQQISLKSKLAENWKIQYESEKAKKPKFTTWQKIKVAFLGALAGYVAAKI